MESPTSKIRTAMYKVVGEHALDFTSAVYGDLLTRLLPQVKEGDWHTNTLILPFTFTCAAALEATLNDHLVAYTFNVFGLENYRRQAEALLTLSLRAKLDSVVPLLSANRFVIRTDSVHYISLSKLISTRNDLVHSKSFFVEGVVFNEDDRTVTFNSRIREKTDARVIRQVDSALVTAFYSALRSLDEDFFYLLEGSCRLSANKLIKDAR